MSRKLAFAEENGTIEQLLNVEELDACLFRSASKLWQPEGARGVFGGIVIGQSLLCAMTTVNVDLVLHSCHCYFLLAANADVPIYYHVECVRDGKVIIVQSIFSL